MNCNIYGFEMDECYLIIPEETDVKDIQEKVKELPGEPRFCNTAKIESGSDFLTLDPVEVLRSIEKQGYFIEWPHPLPYNRFRVIYCRYCRKLLGAQRHGREVESHMKKATLGMVCFDCMKRFHPEAFQEFIEKEEMK